MTIVKSIPDWQGAINKESYTILPTFGDGNQYFLLPTEVHLRQQNGKPDFYLNFICEAGYSSPEDSIYTIINMGLERDAELENAFAYLRQQKPQATLTTAIFSAKAFWHLETSAVEPIVQPFAWENVDTARIYQRIPQNVGILIYQGLKKNHFLARAAIDCEIVVMLPRLPLNVSFQPDKLLSAVQDLNPEQSIISWDKMYNFFLSDPSTLPLKINGDYNVTKRGEFARTLAGHVRKNFGSFVPSPSIADGPHISLKDPADKSLPPEMVWDLSTPLMAATPFMFTFEPFEGVFKIVGKEGIDKVTHFSIIPPLPDEQTTERVFIDGNLPPNLQDVFVVEVNLRVESEYAPNNVTEIETIPLFPNSDNKRVDLKFKNPNQKQYNAQVRMITPEGRLLGDKFEHTGDYLYIGGDSLPAHYIIVRAREDLLKEAELDVAIANPNSDHNKPYLLNTNQPAVTFVLSPEDDALKVVARSISDSSKTLNLNLPIQSISLNLFSFPEFGVQRVEVEVNFQTDTNTAVFEFLPEGSDEQPIVKYFTPDNNQQVLTYTPKTLFNYRYRYRQQKQDNSSTAWSNYLLPNEPLTLNVLP